MIEEPKLPSTEDLPPVEEDPLYKKLAHGSSHATQVVPNYTEFTLGHGDPLLKASMKHDLEGVHANKSVEEPGQYVERDIHLITKHSPLSGMGMNDVVHLAGDEVISVPCLPLAGPEPSPAAQKLKAAMIAVDWASNLQKSTFTTSMSPHGFSDKIHLPDGSVISVPMLPFHHSELARK